MYYLWLIVGTIIGQTFAATVIVYITQLKNHKISYPKALKMYLKKERGSFMLIISSTILLLFVLPDIFDLNKSREELLANYGTLTKFEYLQTKFRLLAVGYGTFLQSLAVLIFKGGRNAIREYGREKTGYDIGDDIPGMPKKDKNTETDINEI